MKILVVTPTLGESPWLEHTIASVARHAPSSNHLLVAPAQKINDLAARYPTTRVIAEPPTGQGMYAAINAGVRAAGTEWEAFTYLNDDDELLAGFTAVARAVATADRPGPLIAYGRVRLIDAHARRLGAIPVSPFPTLNRALYAERLEPVYQHGALVTRAGWELLGGFDETFRFCGDSEFLARACVNGIRFLRVKGEVAAFRLRAGQLTKNRTAMLAERARVDGKLDLLNGPGAGRRSLARAVFRFANAPVYVERLMRHGFVSFDELLAGTKG